MFRKFIIIFSILIFNILGYTFFVFSQDQSKQYGIKYLNEGEYRKAIEALEHAILRNPRDAEALFYLGIAYRNLGSGQLKNALSGISQALKIRPNDPNWQYALAQTYDDMDKFGVSLTDTFRTTYELAIEAYKKAISLKYNFTEAHLSLGELYLRKGKYEFALEKFKDVIKIYPENELSYSYLVDCLSKLERYDEAITTLNRWSNINPSRLEPYNLKAKIYWLQGRYEEAQREYRRVIDIDPNNQLARARLDSILIIIQNETQISRLLKRGEDLFYAQKYEQAIVQLEEIIKIDPSHSIANVKLKEARKRLSDYWFNRGLDRVSNKDLEGAVKNFNQALELAQNTAQMKKIIKKWQEVQRSLGEKAMMWEVIKKGEEYNIDKKIAEAMSYFDVVYQEGWGDQDKVRAIRDSLKIANSYNFALNKEKSGDLIAALVFYQETMKLDSNYKDIKYRIEKLNGDIAFSRGIWSSAITHYKVALQITPGDPFCIERIKQAKTSKYFPYILLFSFLVIIGSIFIVFNIARHKPFIQYYAKFVVLAFLVFVLIYLIVFIITLRSNQINFEQGFQFIGTVFIIFLFFISVLIQKQTYVNFDLAGKLIEFSLPAKDDIMNTFKILNDNHYCESVLLRNFKHVKLQIKSLNGNALNSRENYELDIRPLNEKDKNFKIKISRKNQDLSISNLRIPYNNKILIKREKDSIQLHLRNKIDTIDESNYSLNLFADGELDLEAEDCIILFNKRPINGSSGLYSIVIKEPITIDICCSRNQEMYLNLKLDKFINDELLSIGEFENVDSISLLDENLQSCVEEGIITIGNKERRITKREYYDASPQSFYNLIIQSKGSNLFFKYLGYLKSLKIGLHNTYSKQIEEIPNYAIWISKNPIFYIILGLLAWMGFLGAIKESNFVEKIMNLF